MADKLPTVNIKDITHEDVDKMDNEALKAAVKSVLRAPQVSLTHKDHRSHSSTDQM